VDLQTLDDDADVDCDGPSSLYDDDTAHSDVDDACYPAGFTPLPNGRFLDIPTLIDVLQSASTPLPKIMENAYIVVDNTANISRRADGQLVLHMGCLGMSLCVLVCHSMSWCVSVNIPTRSLYSHFSLSAVERCYCLKHITP